MSNPYFLNHQFAQPIAQPKLPLYMNPGFSIDTFKMSNI